MYPFKSHGLGKGGHRVTILNGGLKLSPWNLAYGPRQTHSTAFLLAALRIAACLALVIAITWMAFSAFHVNALIVGFGYVLAVLVVAAQWGLIESLASSPSQQYTEASFSSFRVRRMVGDFRRVPNAFCVREALALPVRAG